MYRKSYKGGSRRGGRNSLSTIVYKGITPVIADQYMCKLRWNTVVSTPGTSPSYARFFHGNGAHDPDPTSINTQPLGFEELGFLYTKYRVYASSIRVEAISGITAPDGGNFLLSVMASPSATPPVNITDMIASPYSKTAVVSNSHGSGSRIFNLYNTTAKMYGQRSIAQETDFEAATIGSNPSRLWYWHVQAEAMNGSSNVVFDFVVIITYYIQFSKRFQLKQEVPADDVRLLKMRAVQAGRVKAEGEKKEEDVDVLMS